MRKFNILFAGSLILAAMAGTAQAAVSFEGRTVRVIVPTGSGGTYHLYCQILSRHLGRHLPGKPTVITENRPGAGGVNAARYMVTAAPKDGTYIAMINPGSIALPGLRPGVGFDTLKMQWLGSMSGRAYVVGVWYKSPPKTLEDAKKMEVLMGTTGKAATSYLIPTYMNKVLGTKFKIITGYKSGGAINLAIERGEVWGRGNFYTGYLGVRPDWIRDKKIRHWVRIGPDRDDLKQVPKLRDLMKTDEQRQMLDILEVSFNIGQAFYAPPGVPANVMKALRKGFEDTMRDPETKKETVARKLPLNWIKHQDVKTTIAGVMKLPKPSFKKLAHMLGFDQPRKKKKK